MAEEYGEIILKAPERILKSFIGAKNSDISANLSALSDYTGVDKKYFEREHYEFTSAKLKSGYLKIAYDCSEWSYIAESIVRYGKGVEIYAQCGNEYGIHKFFALTKKAKKFSFSVDAESEEFENEESIEHTLEQINEWVYRVPNSVKKSFPDFCEVDTDKIIPINLSNKSKPQVNLNIRFDVPVTEKQITDVLHDEYNEFELKRYENSKRIEDEDSIGFLRPGLGYWEENRIEIMNLQPEHFKTFTVAEWFPISENHDKTAEDLLEILLEAGLSPTYAINFFGNKLRPYRILLCNNSSVDCIFDCNDYTEKELNFLSDDENDDLGMKVNGLPLQFEQIAFVHEKYSLKENAEMRLTTFREKHKEDSEQHNKIWADHPGMQEPLLQDLELAFFCRDLKEFSADDLVHKLQVKGMHKESVNTDLSAIAGKNVIVVPENYKKAAEWLKTNIQELHNHKVIVDYDLDPVVVINMF